MGRSPDDGRDWVDHVRAQWARERPDLDTSPVAVIGRLGRLGTFLDAGLERVFRHYGLSRADFDVLAVLRRQGAPYSLPQKVVMRSVLRTSGTLSVRIDRLERKGLVRREPDPADRRGVTVELTERGRELIDIVAPVHWANEAQLLSALTPAQREDLADLLRILLMGFEAQEPPGVEIDGQREGCAAGE
jgi:DNA-binding MarR family transcriptional regulator